MKSFSETPLNPLLRLVHELSKLPGLGEKTATRLSYFILRQDLSYAQALSQAILRAKEQTRLCERCFSYTESHQCGICRSPQRDSGLICVLEHPSDVDSIERTRQFLGLYHILHGTLSPLKGVGPEHLKITALMQRLTDPHQPPVREIIFATNPSVEGEATALYLTKLIQPLKIALSKLAHGIPVGGVLEYTDGQTLSRAFSNRMEIH